MRYLMLIYSDETSRPAPGTPEMNDMMGAYFAYTKEMEEGGFLRGGEALQPIATATVVRVRNGKTLTTDGPYAETKEQLGGYYMLDCKDLDQAIEFASRIPSALFGSIEIRPIHELG